MKKNKIKKSPLFYEDLVEDIKIDFAKRQKDRKVFESSWKLNHNFFVGNQQTKLNIFGDVQEISGGFYWQEKQIFNHIAPIIESRISKLSANFPQFDVIPSSSQQEDVKVAKLAKCILNKCYSDKKLLPVINKATVYSEIFGTSFYKIVWDEKQQDVDVQCISPYEIYPDSNTAQDIENCQSIIHAKVYTTLQIKNIWGVDVDEEEVNVYDFSSNSNFSFSASAQSRRGCAVVLERYEAPNADMPNGRLCVVCQNKILYLGELPYKNLLDGKRGFPFVKQTSLDIPNCFWGTSVIERLIPIQISYNAVKNRKHEYINRLSMGVLCVEDGSVDVESLQEDGLVPGKVLVYRQGSSLPQFLQTEKLPSDFEQEEERLLAEFSNIGGSGMISSSTMSKNLSGTALELLVEQDNEKLKFAMQNINVAVTNIANQILRLYKQFAIMPKLISISNDNGEVETFYWNKLDISSSEIIASTMPNKESTLKERKQELLKLLNAGLLQDKDGKIDETTRLKLLEQFGFGIFDDGVDVRSLHKAKAEKENLSLLKDGKADILPIDDHQTHISVHTAFVLSREFDEERNKNPEIITLFLEHIEKHKELLNK